MVFNGYISIITENLFSFDVNGNPVPPTLVKSVLIPANIGNKNKQITRTSDRQLINTKYIMYCDAKRVYAVNGNSTITNIELFDKQEVSMGVFQVQDVFKLAITNIIKITV